jgi:hypothetical protein
MDKPTAQRIVSTTFKAAFDPHALPDTRRRYQEDKLILS